MALDFPSSPTTGQSVTIGGVTWVWDGVKWTTSGSAGPAMPMAIGDNRIINGDMRIDQRNNGAQVSNVLYGLDRWLMGQTVASKYAVQRVAISAAAAQSIGFAYVLQIVSSSAYAALAADSFSFAQRIEADMIADLMWGGANAQPVTLSFWVAVQQAGTYSGSIINADASRSYPFSFSIPVANAYTRIVVTIPGDTAGTWVMSGNGVGVVLRFDLGSGANFRGPANVWASANYVGVTGSMSVVATSGAYFNVTGVKLEIGSVATPYNRQSLAKSLADCQRYYQGGTAYMVLYCSIAGVVFGYMPQFSVPMRASPTVNIVSPSYTNASGATANNIGPNATGVFATGTAVGTSNFVAPFTASAEL